MSIVLKRLEKRLMKSLEQTLNSEDLEKFKSNNRKNDGKSEWALSWLFFRLGDSGGKDFEKNLKDDIKTINNIARKALSKILVEEDASLNMEYGAFRGFLKASLESYSKTQTNNSTDNPIYQYMPLLVQSTDTTKQITNQVCELFDLSMLLDQKYTYLINSATMTKEILRTAQTDAIAWLSTHATDEYPDRHKLLYARKETIETDVPRSTVVREITDKTNKYRLFLARFWRFLRILIAYLQNAYYSSLMLLANPLASIVILYAAIGFFIPRMITTISDLFKHVVPGYWMSAEEKELGFWLRFNAQWMRLWPNASNDAAWITNGVLQLVYFVGALLPFVIFLSVATSAYDFSMACLRFAFSSYRFDKLNQEYKNLSSSEQPMDVYLTHLGNKINQEKHMLYLNLLNFFVLLVGMALALPWIVLFNPVLPLVGAVMAVFITIVNFGTRDYFDNKKRQAALQFNLELSELLNPKPIEVQSVSKPKPPITTENDTNPVSATNTTSNSTLIIKLSSSFSQFFYPAQRSPTSINRNLSAQNMRKNSFDESLREQVGDELVGETTALLGKVKLS